MRELSQHVLDLVYNSVEAGARRVEIAIEEDSRADRFTLRVADDGRGMTADEARRALDPFYTTRSTRRVGLGLPLLCERARDCGGDVRLDSRPGHGATVTAWLQRSHIDRQPLGDMAGTLVALLAGVPDVAFHYRHAVDGQVFELDSEELKREMEDVPLCRPAVARWLREHLAAGLGEIGAQP